MSNEKENKDNFDGWDSPTTEMDFFGENQEVISTEATEVVEEIKNDDVTTESKTEEGADPKPKVEEEVTFSFEKTEEEEESEEGGEGNEAPTGDDDIPTGDDNVATDASVSTVKFLKDKGLIDFEMEDGAELTPEIAEEILEDSLEEKVDNKLTDLFNELPDVVKELNKFAMQGGDVNDFFNKIAKPADAISISADMDMTKDENKELVIKHQLKSEGYDDEYIDSNIEFLKDSGKLDSVSTKHFDKWKEEDKANKTALFKKHQEKVKQDKEKIRKHKSLVATTLKNTKELNGFKITKDDVKSLPSYMSDRKVKLEDGKLITEMEKDLYSALRDKDKQLLIAKILKNDFNFEDFQTNATTKVAKEVKENLRRGSNNTPVKSASGSSQKNKKESLADFF